jgi:hypothetical protein
MSTPPSNLLFCIVGTSEPLYTAEFLRVPTSSSSSGSATDTTTQYYNFLLHSSLDTLVPLASSTSNTFLRTVARLPPLHVSAFITPSNVKFLLLHPGRSDETLKAFFNEIYEIYVKYLMNPFVVHDAVIESKAFDDRVRSVGRKYLS